MNTELLEKIVKEAIVYGYNLSINASLAQKDVINYNFETIIEGKVKELSSLKAMEGNQLPATDDIRSELIAFCCACNIELSRDKDYIDLVDGYLNSKDISSGKPQIEQGKEKCKRKQDNSDSICPDCGKDHYEGRNV